MLVGCTCEGKVVVVSGGGGGHTGLLGIVTKTCR